MEISYDIPECTFIGTVICPLYINNSPNFACDDDIVSFVDYKAILFTESDLKGIKINEKNEIGYLKDWFAHKPLTITFEISNLLPFPSYENWLPNYDKLMITRLQYTMLSWRGKLDWHPKKMKILPRKILKTLYNKKNDYSPNRIFEDSRVLDKRQLYI